MSNLAIEVNPFLSNELFMCDHIVVLSKPANLADVVYDTELKQSVITDNLDNNLERFIHICTIKINNPDHLYSYVEFETIDDYINENRT